MKAIKFIGFGNKQNYSDGHWLSLYNKISKCRFIVDSWGYFDERPQISTNITTLIMFVCLALAPFTSAWLLLSLVFVFIGWGDLYVYLPIKTGKTDESESLRYGFYFYCTDSPEWHLFEMVVLRWGEIYKSIDMPWSFDWYRTSILLKTGDWEHEVRGDRKDFYQKKWDDARFRIAYNYRDSYDNTVIPCIVTREKREWRRRWLMWAPLFNMVRDSINVEFSKEVGRKKGSWKGGTTGCGYTLKKGETAYQCVVRMERERKF